MVKTALEVLEVLEETQMNDVLQDAGMTFLRNVAGSKTYAHEMLIEHGIENIMKRAFNRIDSGSMETAEIGVTLCTLRNMASGPQMHRLIIDGGFLSCIDVIAD